MDLGRLSEWLGFRVRRSIAPGTSKEWEAFLDDFQQTLNKFKVPFREQGELIAIVNSTRSDIVGLR
jgi:hypothetical protein